MSKAFCDGIDRRQMLRAGLADSSESRCPRCCAPKQPPRLRPGRSRKAVVFLELVGGPSHFETYDPKPNSPAEYRGPFESIATKLSGIRFSERMERQAQVADKLAVIRSVAHDSGIHRTSAHLFQTGYYLRDRGAGDNEMPSAGSITAKLRGANAPGMPPYVTLPRDISFGRAGWLGAQFNAFGTVGNPSKNGFRVPNVSLLRGLTAERLAARRAVARTV